MLKLDKEDNFITADEILNELKNEIPTYFERGIIDDSIFYPHIKYCLSKMGLKIHPTSEVVIPIRNYKGQLPYDFYKMESAIGCFDYVVTSNPDYNNPKIYDLVESQVTNYLISKPTVTALDQDGSNFYVIQKFEQFSLQYTTYSPLTVSKESQRFCTNNCPNKQPGRADQIEIQKSQGLMVTNFESGSVFMEYLQTLELATDEGMDLLIPDYEQIKLWVKDYLMVKLFTYLFNNTTLDIQARLREAKANEVISRSNAESFVKRFEFTDLYNLRKLLRARYKKFDEIVNGPIPYNRQNRVYGR